MVRGSSRQVFRRARPRDRVKTDNAELGTKRDDEREGYRALLVNRHAIYYTATRSTIHVVRVLHVQMDLDEGL